MIKKTIVSVFLLFVFSIPVQAQDQIYLPNVSHGQMIEPDCTQEMIDSIPEMLRQRPYPSVEDHLSTQSRCILRSELTNVGPPSNIIPANIDVSASATGTTSWASHVLDCYGFGCSNTYGVRRVRAFLTGRKPTLTGGGSWSNYSFVNRIITSMKGQSACGTTPYLSIGTGYGNLNGATTVSGSYMKLYWQVYSNSGCYTSVASWDVDPNTALVVDMYITSWNGNTSIWKGRVWVGYWLTLFSNVSMPIKYSNTAEAGFLVWAWGQDKNNVHAPLNFAHKLNVSDQGTSTYKPWRDGHMFYPLLDNTVTLADAPFNMMDNVQHNYTSVAVTLN